jgi:hypothetical protein
VTNLPTLALRLIRNSSRSIINNLTLIVHSKIRLYLSHGYTFLLAKKQTVTVP